jgi:hypothetical protein
MEQLWITALLNKVLGGPVNAFLQALPPAFHPANPEAPISNAVAMEVLVIVILISLFLWVRSRLTVQGAEVYTMTPAEFVPFFEGERKRWAGVVAKGGVKLE